MLAIGANAAFPVASIEFQSWEAGKGCEAGLPAHGEPKLEAHLTATPMTCDKAPLASQWDVDFYSFKAHLDTKDALLCEGASFFNTDDCSGNDEISSRFWIFIDSFIGELKYFLPFHGSPVEQGVCLPEGLFDPGYLSVKLICEGFGGPAAGGPGGPGGHDGPDGY